MITATLEKKKGGKIGLKLTSEAGKLWVTKIAEGGAMDQAKTDLEVGMEVIEINGESALGMASTDAAKMMLDTDGTLTIKARHPLGAFVCGTFTKSEPTTKVGLRLEDGGDRVMINSIREDTLAYNTELGGGMAIRLINNTDCVGKDAMFVAQLLADRMEMSEDPTVKRAAPKLVNAISRAVTLCESTLAFGKAEERAPALTVFQLGPLVDSSKALP